MNRVSSFLVLLFVFLVAAPGGLAVDDSSMGASATPPTEFVGLGNLSTPPAGAQAAKINQLPEIATVGARIGDKQERIRFIGVDVGDIGEWECLGWQAFDRIYELLPRDAEVYVETGPEVRDGSGNLYAFVWFETPTGYRLISETLLAEGLGSFVEPDAEHSQYTSALRNAANHAQENGLGIWNACGGDIHAKSSPCETVNESLFLETSGFNVSSDYWLRGGHAVRSPSLGGWYLVGADVEGPGAEGKDQIGVWVANSIESEAFTTSMTLPGPAREFQAFFPPHPFEDIMAVQGVAASADDFKGLVGYDELIECVRGVLN